MARSKYETGGEQPRLIKFSDSAAEQTLPSGCVAIYPLDGCSISSLKRSDSSSVNYALGTASDGFLNIATYVFATGKLYPIKVKSTDKNTKNNLYWSKITLSAGECLAIFE